MVTEIEMVDNCHSHGQVFRAVLIRLLMKAETMQQILHNVNNHYVCLQVLIYVEKFQHTHTGSAGCIININ